ncbi:peroxisomal copper amine oxidase [Pyricularia oryzae 70-15]|uniref:Amine oxidase n=1 Tax=Pyricularia oryzae (strain 70-15 / ATCC MYA-4617 / FGSC 8958) TaxID=242507 RepID=G4N0I2_PYRO7|nr:peroxisomal copper amine oxidase [Pyricularia oryzae 70-15]EHA52316.1 peroxisomal copper amine oxidase [Pyricularia oryzae 70-15]
MTTRPSHPFDPLGPQEIAHAASIVRKAHVDSQLAFRAITLQEPAKDEMITFLEAEASSKTSSNKRPDRLARVQVFVQNMLHDIIVNLDAEEIVKNEKLVGRHSFSDTVFMQNVAEATLADPRVQDEIKQLDLPGGATVIVEPWSYATDGENDMTERVAMAWFYMRLSDHDDANYYAYPLDLCAEVSGNLEVTKIYRLPSGADDKITTEHKKPFDHRKIHTNSEYHPDLLGEVFHAHQLQLPRGNRSLFYRLSLSEMFVPYADPRRPYPRKGAFDLGSDGAGINANNLKLGCDCLGHIKYFDGWLSTASGDPLLMPNVVCCHEVDDGILWKHTNYRTGNAVVTRSRVLVLQTIITVSNYEYIFMWNFHQDGSIFYEVRATGIVSTAPIDLDEPNPPRYGTVVAPGVLAPCHQHLFCLRIDPAIDGRANSLVVEETRPMPPGDRNPYGMGFGTDSQVVETERGLHLDFTKNRTFKMVNENVKNPVAGGGVGFKLLPCYSQLLLADPTSFHARRSEYASHAVWVTRHSDEELFPAGRWTMQSAGGEGISSWINKRAEDDRGVRDRDIVVWHTFGSTHNPRVEDWPVMPCEKMVVGLKPVNFFQSNPALDVALSTQERNCSVLVEDPMAATHGNPAVKHS